MKVLKPAKISLFFNYELKFENYMINSFKLPVCSFFFFFFFFFFFLLFFLFCFVFVCFLFFCLFVFCCCFFFFVVVVDFWSMHIC